MEKKNKDAEPRAERTVWKGLTHGSCFFGQRVMEWQDIMMVRSG